MLLLFHLNFHLFVLRITFSTTHPDFLNTKRKYLKTLLGLKARQRKFFERVLKWAK